MSPDTYTFATHPRHTPCTTFDTRLALHGLRPCALHRACAQFCSQSVLDSCATAQDQNPMPHSEGPKRLNAALEQVGSRSCGECFRQHVQVSRSGAAACLLPACSTLSHRPLCRNVPRRAGHRDHQHPHGHRGHRRRRLRASRRHRGRLLVHLPAARNSTAVLVALACRPADGVAVRRPSARRGRAQVTRAAERSALGQAERRKLVARRMLCTACGYTESVRMSGTV